MPSPLIRYTDRTIALPTQYFGSISYYAVLAAHSHVLIHNGMKYDKRFKSTHRMSIADTRGVLELTMPVSKPESSSAASWNDITVSDHGNWWNIQLTALESAYGRTPFFEFYIDSFADFFKKNVCGTSLTTHNAAIDLRVRTLLGIDSEVMYIESQELPEGVLDHRRCNFSSLAEVTPYYQVRASELGFISNLSILDLLFNLGPESPVYLRRVIDGLK
ncbi:MAG: WbqC family protein [Paramuribaculum sp.]|nr:WbqC family protein [Paramuribaculum sp.]